MAEGTAVSRECRVPCRKIVRLDTAPADPGHPVGILLDPRAVGDAPSNQDDHLRFYPCKVKEKDFSQNLAKISPMCPPETTYQTDFLYRGKDQLLCHTYEFQTDSGGDNCEFFFCVPYPAAPKRTFGKRRTDLKPAKTKTEKEANAGAYDPWNPKTRITEYMASTSKLGREILEYNLFRKAERKEERLRKQLRNKFK